MATLTPSTSRLSTLGWRTPAVIVVCGCVISFLSFGPRASLGFFLTPMSQANGWDRDVFGLALAIQNILWGAGQPLAGAIADRFGTIRVLSAGGILYAIGLVLMAYSSTPGMLNLGAGVLIGFGLAGCSFSVVLGAFGKLMPESWRLLAFGAGMLLVLPLSLALATAPAEAGTSHGVASQSLGQALSEAVGHRSYILLVLGFFTCGFQLAFITVHMPAYLVDRGLSSSVGAWTIGAIGLFNIVGSLASGWLGNVMPKRYLLSFIYFARAAAVLAFISFPVTAATSIMFGAVMGLLWLSTVPPTNGIIALMFGTRWLATLAGLAFFSHQVGGFLGVWLGGVVFVRTGSYDAVWWLSVLFGVLSAVVNLPIVEKPVPRLAAA
jgi:MFS family permease